MKATDILMEEHRVIERVLDALEIAANRLLAGQVIPMDFFLKATDFIKNFADGCHHKKEEGVLFVALAANGMSQDTEPLCIMLAEHEEGRHLTRALREGAEWVQGGDTTAMLQRPLWENSRPVRLTFARQESSACSKKVLFPDFNQNALLPEGEQVILEFTPEKAGEYGFQCQMGMMRGKLIVE